MAPYEERGTGQIYQTHLRRSRSWSKHKEDHAWSHAFFSKASLRILSPWYLFSTNWRWASAMHPRFPRRIVLLAEFLLFGSQQASVVMSISQKLWVLVSKGALSYRSAKMTTRSAHLARSHQWIWAAGSFVDFIDEVLSCKADRQLHIESERCLGYYCWQAWQRKIIENGTDAHFHDKHGSHNAELEVIRLCICGVYREMHLVIAPFTKPPSEWNLLTGARYTLGPFSCA